MPSYTYKCNDCDKTFDRFRKISDREDGGQCPECGGDNTKQAITAPLGVKGGYMDTSVRVSVGAGKFKG